ncbi:hypothetical protein [Nocardia blacklockiae]|uniref:hypothetical protein n=1 Tax=Nocardia blacklockiae TaxID=480036 RepID=UPI0018945665|nr:hypothetical protein [Nocardia blacklockiae]MBF6175155.1 hypothetical protein [Nocardia blacklockiae]
MRAYQTLVDTPSTNRFARRVASHRFARATSIGESVLFRLICTDLGDPAPRYAYGDIAMRRSVLAAGVRGRMMSEVTVNAARAVLWAWDRPELITPDPGRIRALTDENPVESPFAVADGTVAVFTGARRVTLAAQARLFLAERLIATQLRIKSDSMTTRDLDATLAARDKFYSSDEWLVWHCRLASCRSMAALPETVTCPEPNSPSVSCPEPREPAPSVPAWSGHRGEGLRQAPAGRVSARIRVVRVKVTPIRGTADVGQEASRKRYS